MEEINPVDPNLEENKNVLLPEKSYISNININEEKFQKKQKKKKEKTVKDFSLLIGKKRRITRPQSDISKIINVLIKKNYKTPEQINSYLITQGKRITDKDQDFYKMLVNSYVVNGNMRISDVLANKPIYGFHYFSSFGTKVVSNDSLYIRALLSISFSTNKVPDISQKLFEYSILDKAIFTSVPFECDGKVEKGYYQDYSGTFAAVGLNTLTAEQKENILKEDNKARKGFKFNDVEYKVYSLESAVVIAPDNMNNDVIKNNFANMKTFNSSGKISMNAKTFDIDDRVKFIESKVTPELFCPAFLQIPDFVKFTLFGRSKYDYNKLFSILQDEYKQLNENDTSLLFPPNFVYWTNMPQCFDFISMFSVTSDIAQQHKERLNGIYSKYISLKDVIMEWKTIQLKLEKFLLEFYHAFTHKINFDTLRDLHKKIDDYIHDRNLLREDERYNDLLDFMSEIKSMSGLINNQFNEKIFNLIDELRNLLFVFETGNSVGLLSDLRDMGYAIYRLSYYEPRNENNKEKQQEHTDQFFSCFPFILSPGAFLGNLFRGMNISDDPLKKIINKLIRERERKANVMADKKDLLVRVLENRDAYADKIIENSVRVYLENELPDVGEEIRNEIKNKIINSDELRGPVNEKISNALASGEKIEDQILSSNIIKPKAINYILRYKNKENDKIMKDLELDKKMNDLLIEKNINKPGEAPSISGESTKTKTYTKTMKRRKKKDEDDEDVKTDVAYSINLFKNDAGKGSDLARYYADLVYFSGIHEDITKDNVDKYAKEYDVNELINMFPLKGRTINLIAQDFNMPAIEDVMTRGYGRRKYDKFKDFNYTDDNVEKVFAGDPSVKDKRKRYKF